MELIPRRGAEVAEEKNEFTLRTLLLGVQIIPRREIKIAEENSSTSAYSASQHAKN